MCKYNTVAEVCGIYFPKELDLQKVRCFSVDLNEQKKYFNSSFSQLGMEYSKNYKHLWSSVIL